MAQARWKKPRNKSWRVFKNEDIKAFKILVVDAEWNQVGTMPRAKALSMAQDKWMDLVQISYDASTKVCTAKIIDFWKYQYEKKKAESDKKKKQKTKIQKEIKFWYNIWDNDLMMKVRKWIEFLEKWHSLKVRVVLRWRERMYKDIVRAKLDGVEDQLKSYWKSQWIRTESFGYSLLVFPLKK